MLKKWWLDLLIGSMVGIFILALVSREVGPLQKAFTYTPEHCPRDPFMSFGFGLTFCLTLFRFAGESGMKPPARGYWRFGLEFFVVMVSGFFLFGKIIHASPYPLPEFFCWGLGAFLGCISGTYAGYDQERWRVRAFAAMAPMLLAAASVCVVVLATRPECFWQILMFAGLNIIAADASFTRSVFSASPVTPTAVDEKNLAEDDRSVEGSENISRRVSV